MPLQMLESNKHLVNASAIFIFTKILCLLQILGIIENMSCFKCPNCGHPSYIFGNGGARKTADEMCLDYLGEVG